MKALLWFKSLDEDQRRSVVAAVFFVAVFGSMAVAGVADGLGYRECIKRFTPKECR